MKKAPVVAIVGPTATGKSLLGIEICKRFNGEIISADSMQVYKRINIASAKLLPDEMQGIPHHLIDFVEPDDSFSAFQYCTLARECIKDIVYRGKLPVIVGGTGMYIDSLLNGMEFSKSDNDRNVREQLKKKALEQGNDILHDDLQRIDPESAARLHPHDIGRIIRALELYYTTGKTATEHNQASIPADSPYIRFIIGLNYRNRQMLYDQINTRVDKMIENGLVEEADVLFRTYKTGTALQAIGIKEFSDYFDGKEELSVCVEKLKQETRRYAKRQMSWFRRNKNINWINVDDQNSLDDVVKVALSLVDASGLIRG